MRILRNQDVITRQSENYIKAELSNPAMIMQTNTVLVTYYSLMANESVTLPGFNSTYDYIGPDSPLRYTKIENFPMCGIDSLLSFTNFDEEVGYTDDLESSGVTFPNTITPKSYDMIIIPNGETPAIYIVTTVEPTTVRSNPFTQINFRLYSRNKDIIAGIELQVDDTYMVSVSSLGNDKTILLSKATYTDLQGHINTYMEICDLYNTIFLDTRRSVYIYPNGYYDQEADIPYDYLDMVLWKFMFDNGIIIYDPIITFAINNMNMIIKRTYTSDPSKYLTNYTYRNSSIFKIINKDCLDEQLEKYRYPATYDEDPRVGKFMGRHSLYYIEKYTGQYADNKFIQNWAIWDDEFICRMKTNTKYDTTQTMVTITNCDGSTYDAPINPYLRNVIIAWCNDEDIEWDSIILDNEIHPDNYYLIPMMMYMYGKYINSLQN